MSALQSISDLTRVPKHRFSFTTVTFCVSIPPRFRSRQVIQRAANLFRSATPHVTSRTASPRQKPDPETKLGSKHRAGTVRSGVPGHRRPNQIFVVDSENWSHKKRELSNLSNCQKRSLCRGDHIKAAPRLKSGIIYDGRAHESSFKH